MVDTGTSPVVGQFGRGVTALEEDSKYLQSEIEFQMKFDQLPVAEKLLRALIINTLLRLRMSAHAYIYALMKTSLQSLHSAIQHEKVERN